YPRPFRWHRGPLSEGARIMKIESPAFAHGASMPEKYSKRGGNVSPPLVFSEVPVSAKSLVLIMDDPDAPHGRFTHWLVFDLDPKTEEIGEDHAPHNARQGTNDWGQAEYGGPKPPLGEHRYFFRLYALDEKIDLPRGST